MCDFISLASHLPALSLSLSLAMSFHLCLVLHVSAVFHRIGLKESKQKKAFSSDNDKDCTLEICIVCSISHVVRNYSSIAFADFAFDFGLVSVCKIPH